MMSGFLRGVRMALYRLGDDSRCGRKRLHRSQRDGRGQSILAEKSTVWFGATLRGDNETISIGANSNVQDLAVLHTDPGFPLSIGVNVSIGHQAMVHGCTVGDGSLIGIQSVVLKRRHHRQWLSGRCRRAHHRAQNIPDGCLIIGSPAKRA